LSVQTHPELMRGAFHQRYYDLVFSKAVKASKERLATAAAYPHFGHVSCALRFKALK
jgi:hypothetical protein